MRQFVDHGAFGCAGQLRLGIHLLDEDAPVVEAPARNELDVVKQGSAVGTTVRFDKPEDDVYPLRPQRVCLFQHAVGLADASGEADVELEAAALGALQQSKKFFGALFGGLTHG